MAAAHPPLTDAQLPIIPPRLTQPAAWTSHSVLPEGCRPCWRRSRPGHSSCILIPTPGARPLWPEAFAPRTFFRSAPLPAAGPHPDAAPLRQHVEKRKHLAATRVGFALGPARVVSSPQNPSGVCRFEPRLPGVWPLSAPDGHPSAPGPRAGVRVAPPPHARHRALTPKPPPPRPNAGRASAVASPPPPRPTLICTNVQYPIGTHNVIPNLT